MAETISSTITKALIEGEAEEVIRLTNQALEAGVDPMDIINRGLVPGMDAVGERYASGEYFLPHLMVAGSAMQQAMGLLEPALKELGHQYSSVGTVVIGTVKGDIHEIGKTLVATLLSANGFEVHDLGVDVPTKTFIEKVKETNADILGLSALLTTTMTMQREIIESLGDADLQGKVRVLVGGAPVTQGWAESIHADGYAEDALGAVRMAKSLMDLR
jgi:corrinoid protein of di/trimethylamine methyltransferase